MKQNTILDEATIRGEEITETVKNWLTDAGNVSEKVDRFLNDSEDQLVRARCSRTNYLLPNLVLRHRLSKKAKKMAQSVAEIIVACKFDSVSYVPILQHNFRSKDYMAFGTRNSIMTGILEALRKDDITSVGVYGMPGIGKTTLVKEVARQALEEKLFDDAIEVTVSESPNLEKVQQDIAKGLHVVFQDEDGVKERSDRLRHGLGKEENLLLILEDVWKKLDLHAIGIDFDQDHQKGCKILLTSRNQDVLQGDMDVNVENNFKIEPLSESEACICFSKIVGDDFSSDDENSELKSTAIKIVEQCACLPLAIVTVAHALKNKGLHAWNDALRRLQNSTMISKKVYSSVRLSYDFLKDEEDGDQSQEIFLLCSLYEEDANISIQDLLNLVTGWGLFQNVYTLEAARDRLQTLLDKLKAHGLLSNGTDVDSVKMHDIIRDVGISIASADPYNMYNIRGNDELKECLENDKLKDAVAISLGANYEDESLPSRLKCSKLHLLWMWRKHSSLPDPFFEEAKELRVLNLSHLLLKPLPQSFCFLQNLQALHLGFANIGDIDLIGEPKKLKVLDLGGSTLVRLAEQIGKLSCLQVLNLRNCRKLEVIPPNVISRLVNLEELNMERSFKNWKVEGVVNDEENNASLSEIKNLAKSTTLFLHIPEANMLPKDLFSTELKRFNITLGADDDHFEGSRILKIKFQCNINSLLGEQGFKMLLKRSENLYMDGIKGLKNHVFKLNKEDGLPHLKNLKVNNVETQCVIKSAVEHYHSDDHNILASLETFSFMQMGNLENICFGERTSPESLGKLREAKAERCGKLKSLLPLSVAKKLEKIVVESCNAMEEVVTLLERQGVVNSELAVNQCIEFPKLKEMKLSNLPKLIGFWSECDTRSCTPTQGQNTEEEPFSTTDSASTLFNQMVAFPCLESLELRKLNMKQIWWDMKLSETSSCNYKLQNLRTLRVHECRSLKYLFSFPIARSLVQLEVLDVSRCKDMEEIVVPVVVNSEDELAAQVDQRIEFPKLKNLKLLDLQHEFIKFSSECNQVEGSSSDSATSFFNPKVAFPSLETLDLWSMECIRIWRVELSAETSYSFQNLTTLEISWCNRLKIALSFAIAKSLVQLQKLSVKECWEMEEILAAPGEALVPAEEKLFPKLEQVLLYNLPKLSRFGSTEILIYYVNIKKLIIENCPLWTTIGKEEDHHQDMNSDRMCLPSDNKMADDHLKISSLNDQQLPSFYITKLEVTRVRSENLLSASVAAAFVHLEILKVDKCELMKEFWVVKMQSYLKTLGLWESVLSDADPALLYHIQCPLLEKLEIDQCPEFRTFISGSTDEETDLEPTQPLFHDQKVAFCNLKSLNLWKCKSINKIWGHGEYRTGGLGCHHHLSSSVILTIGELPNLNLLMDFQKLTSLESKKSGSSWCQSMREIIATDDDDDDKELQQGSSSSSLVVGNCPKMSNFCDHVTVTAPELHTFMSEYYVGWRVKEELNSNDNVQVDHKVFKKDDMVIEEFVKEGGDKYINIKTPIRQLWEKFQNQPLSSSGYSFPPRSAFKLETQSRLSTAIYELQTHVLDEVVHQLLFVIVYEVDEVVSKAFKYPAATDAHVCITNKAALGKVLDDVKKKMSTLVENAEDIITEYLAGQRTKMEESCFGQLSLQFNVKFSAAIMGPVPVNCPSPPSYSYERIREEYFNRADIITNAMVKDVYTITTQWIEDDDMVKLSLLYILECGLLGKENHFKVNMDHVRMVDDLPTFNGYPWGELAWEATLNSLQRLWRSLIRQELTVWGYEAIPKLGKLTAQKSDDVVFPPICRWYSTISINYQILKNKLFSEEGDHDAGGDVEPPLKRARTTIIHEGGDAHHSSTQELPHQNVHHFEDASSRQLQLIQSDIATLKKQFNGHQLYVKSELMSIKETLKCILTFTLMDKKASEKGESSQKYIIPPSVQDEDVIYHGLIVKDVDTENNEDVNKKEDVNKEENTEEDDTHKHAKDDDVHVQEGPSNDDQGDGDSDVQMDAEPSNNDQNEDANNDQNEEANNNQIE
ncbi:hypothetical protein FNV43_RR02450 [Rhamnella rubrinervis]|uniref:AAA+ ATPase domain-containing protein n=1 Tax=Rhamnella rubrinervis TaxID=2594499 RepID=A0A8K0MSZ9_9ROSA|nr:hypothetical protein FNV43_RR02450 [Rhamnella rubrinervis]